MQNYRSRHENFYTLTSKHILLFIQFALTFDFCDGNYQTKQSLIRDKEMTYIARIEIPSLRRTWFS